MLRQDSFLQLLQLQLKVFTGTSSAQVKLCDVSTGTQALPLCRRLSGTLVPTLNFSCTNFLLREHAAVGCLFSHFNGLTANRKQELWAERLQMDSKRPRWEGLCEGNRTWARSLVAC